MDAKRRLETREVADRVRGYGGIIEAIESGIGSGAIADPELAAVWNAIEKRYAALRPSLLVASRMIVASRKAA